MSATTKSCLAILEAKAETQQALRQALIELLAPTRAEPGCLDYVLFADQRQPGRYIMRESFVDEAAFQAHLATAHFQAFFAQSESLLAQPIELVPIERIG